MEEREKQLKEFIIETVREYLLSIFIKEKERDIQLQRRPSLSSPSQHRSSLSSPPLRPENQHQRKLSNGLLQLNNSPRR